MALSPEDIESKEFIVSLRGYDKDDVRAFLKEVAGEFRNVGSAQAAEPDPVDRVTRQLGAVLRAAMEESDLIVAEARRELEEADGIRRQAREEAAAIRQQAEEYAEQVRAEADNRGRRWWGQK